MLLDFSTADRHSIRAVPRTPLLDEGDPVSVRSHRWAALVATAGIAALALTGCAQQNTAAPAASAAPVQKVENLPAPFDGEPVKVALVQQSGAGDFFTACDRGREGPGRRDQHRPHRLRRPQRQREAGVRPRAGDRGQARRDHRRPRSDRHDRVARARRGGCRHPGHRVRPRPEGLHRGHRHLAVRRVDGAGRARSARRRRGRRCQGGLASTDGFAPLERRKKVWDEVVAEHGLDQLFFTGKVTESTATDNIPLIDAALKANPGSRRSSPPTTRSPRASCRPCSRTTCRTRSRSTASTSPTPTSRS